MESKEHPYPSAVFQKFKSNDGTPLAGIRPRVCANTDEKYHLWKDVQNAFPGVGRLETADWGRVLFTIDKDGELFRPVRIKHDPDNTYFVITFDQQGQRPNTSHRILPEIDWGSLDYFLPDFLDSPNAQTTSPDQEVSLCARYLTDDTLSMHMAPFLDRGPEDTLDLVYDGCLPPVQYLINTCKSLYELLQSRIDTHRAMFREIGANALYYHSTLVEGMKRTDKDQVMAMVDGNLRNQTLKELDELKKSMPVWDYKNCCWSMLHEQDTQTDLKAPKLFVVLPSDLDLWDDSDPSTHQFRLYYMCDNSVLENPPEDLPSHVHLSNHPGYNLKQPHEFLQVYGYYVLRVLLAIKYGYSYDAYNIPSLHNFEILWSCDPDILGNRLTKDTLESLVDKTIAFLLKLFPPKYIPYLRLTQAQLNAVKNYLDIQEGDNMDGNLHRYYSSTVFVQWKCQAHAQQYLSQKYLEDLKEFVYGHRGHIDMRRAALRVDLRSTAEADMFRTLLIGTNHTFEVFIKLSWKATRSYMDEFCQDIVNAGTRSLEIDGINTDIHPQSLGLYLSNIFANTVSSKRGIHCLTLLNYPQPKEQCIHFEYFSLQSAMSTVQQLDFLGITHASLEFIVFVFNAHGENCNTAAMEFQSKLETLGLSDVTLLTRHHQSSEAVFDLNLAAFVEFSATDLTNDKLMDVTWRGSIQRMALHLIETEFSYPLLNMLRTSPGLQDLSVSYSGRNVIFFADQVVRKWHHSSSPFRLTLIDRMQDTRGKVIAQLAIRRGDKGLSRNGFLEIYEANIGPSMDALADIQFLLWDCEHIFGRLSDYSSTFLDMATRQHPSVLNLIALDVSGLASIGLDSIAKVLCRSNLEHLNIVCTRVDSQLSKHIPNVLSSIQWESLQSLVLSGACIDEWLQLLPSPAGTQLLCLQIRGTSPHIQELSHTSILVIQQLIFASPLVELNIESAQLQEHRDWWLMVDSMSLSLLKTLSLGQASFHQFMSTTDAVDYFVSRIKEEEEAGKQGAENAKVTLPAFTLDVITLSEQDFVNIQKALRLSNVKLLYVKCLPFDHHLSDRIVHLLGAVQWSTLETLQLVGDNLNQWVQLMNKIDAPRLRRLDMWGSESVQQELTHASVSFVQQAISSSPLEEMNIGLVQLQDTQDWVRLVESMEPMLLRKVSLSGSSYDQFMTNTEAVDLDNLKRTGQTKVE